MGDYSCTLPGMYKKCARPRTRSSGRLGECGDSVCRVFDRAVVRRKMTEIAVFGATSVASSVKLNSCDDMRFGRLLGCPEGTQKESGAKDTVGAHARMHAYTQVCNGRENATSRLFSATSTTNSVNPNPSDGAVRPTPVMP